MKRYILIKRELQEDFVTHLSHIHGTYLEITLSISLERASFAEANDLISASHTFSEATKVNPRNKSHTHTLDMAGAMAWLESFID
jgi:hypothetical protein